METVRQIRNGFGVHGFNVDIFSTVSDECVSINSEALDESVLKNSNALNECAFKDSEALDANECDNNKGDKTWLCVEMDGNCITGKGSELWTDSDDLNSAETNLL